MSIISNCPLCEERALHYMEQEQHKYMQCINCGYASTEGFVGTKEDNEEYYKLTPEMKKWSKEYNGRIWIPSVMTLPTGIIYPITDSDEMRWAYSKVVNIPEEEQKNYPTGRSNENEKFYKRKYDVENFEKFNTFFDAMIKLNEDAKEDGVVEIIEKSDINLPKLKRVE